MLTFKFKKEKLKDGSFSYRPIIPVRFVNERRFINAFVLLDTGADITVLPLGFAKILDLKLVKEKEKLKGFREACEVYSSMVEVRIGRDRLEKKFSVPVLVLSEEDSLSEDLDAVIGLRGFFDRFDVRLKLASNKIELLPTDNLRRITFWR